MIENASTPGRRGRLALGVAQWMAIALGIVLIGWYLVARGRGDAASTAAIEEFRGRQGSVVTVEPLTTDPSGLPLTEPVDTSLWSEVRIDEYRRTLVSDERVVLGILSIPGLNLEVPIFDGTDDWVLNRGAGRIEGTSTPGEGGNVGIAAHRDSFFRVLQDIAVGDTLLLETMVGTESYSVEGFQIVEPTDVWVLEPTEEPTVTLVTCYPFYFVGSAPQRFIVRATAAQIADESSSAVR